LRLGHQFQTVEKEGSEVEQKISNIHVAGGSGQPLANLAKSAVTSHVTPVVAQVHRFDAPH
jgi:adenine C2-methylase RlmN of 23S rRNA A2503 and tRNA A37